MSSYHVSKDNKAATSLDWAPAEKAGRRPLGTRLRVEAPHKAEEQFSCGVQDLPREQTGCGRPGEESDLGQWEMVSGVVRRLSDSGQHTGPAGLSGWARGGIESGWSAEREENIPEKEGPLPN